MKTALRIAAVVALSGATAGPAAAQYPTVLPPEPLPMGVPYVYQPGNPYWFQPLAPYPSYYPFGATRPIFGRYSWDYNVYVPAGIGYYTPNLPHYPYSYAAPSLPGRVWYGFGW